MAELTLKIASQLIGYTNCDITIPVPDDITPEEIARLHWDWNMRFLLEQEKVANEPVTEKQEKEIGKAAKALTDEKLPATVLDVTTTEQRAAVDEHTRLSREIENTPEIKPWEQKTEPAEKPWQKAPKFNNLFG